jgi:hypothetical protein
MSNKWGALHRGQAGGPEDGKQKPETRNRNTARRDKARREYGRPETRNQRPETRDQRTVDLCPPSPRFLPPKIGGCEGQNREFCPLRSGIFVP